MIFSQDIKTFKEEYSYQNITVDGAEFRYILAGQEDKPAVVLLNGGMNCNEMWCRYIKELSGYCRVLTFDYPRELTDAVQTADVIVKLMEKLKIDRAVLVGASFGGFMAQIIAKRHPERVCGIGLFSTGAITEKSIKRGRKKYRIYSILLWLYKRKHFNYEKLKPKLLAASMKYAENESEENRRYVNDMLEYVFNGYTKEKDIHITTVMVSLMNIKPCCKEDFDFLNGNVVLVLPEKDFFSEDEQKELIDTFSGARLQYVKNGHYGTILECEKYFTAIKSLL